MEGLRCLKDGFCEATELMVKSVPILVHLLLFLLKQCLLTLFIPFIPTDPWTNRHVCHEGLVNDAQAVGERDGNAFCLFVACRGEKRRSFGVLLI